MFIRLKAASVAVLGTLCYVAGMAGVSLADENVPMVPAMTPVETSPSSPQLTQPVAFAVLKEVVQPLPGAAVPTDSEVASRRSGTNKRLPMIFI